MINRSKLFFCFCKEPKGDGSFGRLVFSVQVLLIPSITHWCWFS